MLKTLLTVMRGAASAAEQEFSDRAALLILDQQLRDAAAALERAQQALAVAIAQDKAEGKRLDATIARIIDLEERAVAALTGGRDDLAEEAAEAIAVMEADRDAIQTARKAFGDEIAHLRMTTAHAGSRLAELERGRRIAQAAEAVRRLKSGVGGAGVAGSAALAQAEATLKRLRERQAQDATAEEALASLVTPPSGIADRLEGAGFGPRRHPAASDVLARLRGRASAAASFVAS